MATYALNTDIILQLSADGGSNYSIATLTGLTRFLTVIKIRLKLGLNGYSNWRPNLKYKILFANINSNDGVKEQELDISLNY